VSATTSQNPASVTPQRDYRKEIARYVLSLGMEPADFSNARTDGVEGAAAAPPTLQIPFPEGLAPVPQPLDPAPATDNPLPQADAVVITWTVDEVDALASVFTPGFGRNAWYRYDRDFAKRYRKQIRAGAPSLTANRLGSYFPVKIGPHDVLCMKSELHLNKDGISDPAKPGFATLPVRDFFEQVISEVQPRLVLTIGTSGGVYVEHGLGDVVVTRGAKFRLADEFQNEPFNHTAYKSDWTVPTAELAKAEELMQEFTQHLAEPPVGAPTGRYTPAGTMLETQATSPKIRLDGRDMPEFHPILTTDYFEYGTTTNSLDAEGAAVEMGDAVLGLVCDGKDTPKWGVVRNLSDPCINGDLPTNQFLLNEQTMWAVGYYTAYGYWTSVNGALATWGILAGLSAGEP
jgi:nucleoside phosphorylase